MNGFSASEAALEGFRLTRERPGTIAIWTTIYAVAMVLIGNIMLRSLGPEAMQIARKGHISAQDGELIATKLASSIPAFLLVLILAVALLSVITAAIFRLILRPDERSFGWLRLGADELRLTLMNLMLFSIGMFCLFVGFVAIALAEYGGPVSGVIVGGIVATVIFWIGIRLSLATPMTFQMRHMSLFAAWNLTRGRFWPMCGTVGLSIIFYIMVWVLVTVIWFTGVMIAGGPEALSQGGTQLAIIGGSIAFILSMLLQIVQLVMIYAPFAVAYQQLHGDLPANPLRMRAEHS